MQFIPSTEKHITAIMQIIDDAKRYLASQHINQWQNGYPNQHQIENDIKNNESFVVIDNQKNVIGTTMFTTNAEPTYKKIDGNWLIDERKPYGVIHRMAIRYKHRGLGVAQFMFAECHQKLKTQHIQSLKIDTHQDNIGMQSLIKKLGYNYCGIIYTDYGAKRLAFEKII